MQPPRPSRCPWIIAHRGFSGQYPENTLAAIRAAIVVGADCVEVDVQQTRDGELIVFHDDRLRRLCGVNGLVAATDYREIRRLNPAVPTLATVLRVCRGKVRVLVEIKQADPVAVAAVTRRARMQQTVIVFGFDIDRLARLAVADPGLTRFGLVGRGLPRALRRLEARVAVAGIGLGQNLVRSRRVIEALHGRGWPVFVWTVNRASTMRRLAAWGVDGIITNYPDRAIAAVRGRAAAPGG